MLLKSLQLSLRSLRGITRISAEVHCNERLQNYSRWASRRPVAIENEHELFDVDLKNTTPPIDKKFAKKKYNVISKDNKREKSKVKAPVETAEEFFVEPEEIEAEYKEDVSLNSSKPKRKPKNETYYQSTPKESKSVYTKIQETEKIVSTMLLSLKTKKQRRKQEKILLEGVRFIRDAMEVGMVPEAIIFSRFEDVKDLSVNEKQTKLYKVPYRSIQLWSTLTTPPGVMGIFQKPEPKAVSKKTLPITVICDNIRDPGNMGSILRACAGVGCEQVILTKGCVDFWDSKVLRSAAGAHFRVPIIGSLEWDDIKSRIDGNAHVYIADNNMDTNIDKEEPDENSELFEEAENEDVDDPPKKESKDLQKRRLSSLKKLNEIPVIPYYSADYTTNEVVLIVGGETHGLSMDSFKLVQNHQGVRVNIPLNNKIESLNAGMALGIVAFEIKRQFLLVQNRLNKMVSN